MMTSKERAALRAQANPLEVTLIVGKSGISQTLLDEAVILLDSHELVKGRVLETAGLTAREASDTAACRSRKKAHGASADHSKEARRFRTASRQWSAAPAAPRECPARRNPPAACPAPR